MCFYSFLFFSQSFSQCVRFSFSAIVLYRVPLTWSRWWCKRAHAGLLFVAVVLSVLGLCAAFDFHTANNIPHLYSLHSWTGISTVALFTLQVQYTIHGQAWLMSQYFHCFMLDKVPWVCSTPSNFKEIMLEMVSCAFLLWLNSGLWVFVLSCCPGPLWLLEPVWNLFTSGWALPSSSWVSSPACLGSMKNYCWHCEWQSYYHNPVAARNDWFILFRYIIICFLFELVV